ncbi:xanthine dehydrogenase family protein subunit M [Myxosarcina sp. GI1]|uniref:FAD binding domain-containing protein n=1 Tax=Myxosarcina sp. GI1 TaxID=1541065 RepID=UPI00055D3182|nr:xanthine dehydrogenase family protein subunit M [Myxosarcina sp. GI1]
MKAFDYTRSNSTEEAISAINSLNMAKYLGGGTNLIDLMKEGVEQPSNLVDVTRLSLAEIEELPNGGVRIGAMARNSDTANHPLIRQRYPVLSQAFLSGASPQLRNMATVGGNLLQRTRCYYFVNTDLPCNKREPGSGCPAIEGFNRIHAILGASEECIATHPSDMCVALAALDATVRVRGTNGEREIALVDFHRLPGDTPQIETELQPGELITAIDLPPMDFANKSYYLKVRDRNSYAFALVSVAAAMDVRDNTIQQARMALGGVAHKPWRAFEAEEMLVGKPATEETFKQAAETVLAGAKTYEHNAFKVELGKRAIVKTLSTIAAG